MKRVLRTALVISLLIHPLIIALLLYQLHFRSPQQIARRERQDPSEIVTISSAKHFSPRAVAAREPQPHKAGGAPPQQTSVLAQRPADGPKPVLSHRPAASEKQDLAKIERGTPVPKPATPTPKTPAPETQERKTVADLTEPSLKKAKLDPKRAKYSDNELAKINSDLATFTHSERGSENPLSNVSRPTAAEAPRHYALDFRAADDAQGGAYGLCDPITSWQADGYDYYYDACTTREADGSITRKNLPWPVRYRPDEDPNLGYGKPNDPIPTPLPGWHPPPGHTIDPDFLGYLRGKGYPI